MRSVESCHASIYMLLRPLPYEDPDDLVRLLRVGDGFATRTAYSLPDLRDIQSEAPAIAAAAGYTNAELNVTEFGNGELVTGARVSNGLLEVFRLSPFLGRDLRADEAIAGGPHVVLVSHLLWQERLGADPAVGFAAAVYASGQLVDLLYDTKPVDPFVFTVAPFVLALVAAAALMVPAGQASRIEPMRVLKES